MQDQLKILFGSDSMFSFFDELFHQYCLLERPSKGKSSSKKSEEIIVSMLSLIIILVLSVVLVVNPCEMAIHTAIGYVILVCTIAVITRLSMVQKNVPSTKQYSVHIESVVCLLQKHNINPNDTDRIKELIAYTIEIMNRRNPLIDVKKAFTIAGSVIAAVWSILSNGLDANAKLNEFILELFEIAGAILACCLIFTELFKWLEYMLFPQKRKMEQLVDDLKQVSIFYSSK